MKHSRCLKIRIESKVVGAASMVDRDESCLERRTNLVVCVDDEKRVLESLQRMLRAEPYGFLTTDDPAQALDWVRTGEVDLVISDFRMPEMSGTALLQIVKATSPRTGRILLTGYPADPGVLTGERDQLIRVCAKPWDDDGLKRTIRELLLSPGSKAS